MKRLLLLMAVVISLSFTGNVYPMQMMENAEHLQEKCYATSRAQGIREFNAKNYREALAQFAVAGTCADKPEKNDLESWVNKCKDRLGQDAGFALEPARVDLPMVGGKVKVEVKADAAEYFIDNLPKWIKVEKYPDYFEMDIPANSTGEVKSVELEISVGENTLKFPVTQESKFSEAEKQKSRTAVPVVVPTVPIQTSTPVVKEPIPLQISKAEISMTAEGGSERIDVSTHDLYYGVSGVPSWIKVDIANDHIVVSCLKNTTGKAREREIYVVTEDERLSLMVKQAAN